MAEILSSYLDLSNTRGFKPLDYLLTCFHKISRAVVEHSNYSPMDPVTAGACRFLKHKLPTMFCQLWQCI